MRLFYAIIITILIYLFFSWHYNSEGLIYLSKLFSFRRSGERLSKWVIQREKVVFFFFCPTCVEILFSQSVKP